jgi:hypothetical protein
MMALEESCRQTLEKVTSVRDSALFFSERVAGDGKQVRDQMPGTQSSSLGGWWWQGETPRPLAGDMPARRFWWWCRGAGPG